MTQVPQPVDERLRAAAAALEGDRVCMQTLADAHGPQARGALLLLIAAPCLLPLPGVGTVLGLGLAALALAMWRGNTVSCLPERVGQLHISRQSAQRVLGFLAATYTLAGKFTRTRMAFFAQVGPGSMTAFSVMLMSFIVVMPIPFGNILPALAVMLMGVGLAFRDGLVVAAGLLLSALTVVVTAGLLCIAWILGSEWALKSI